MRLDDERGIYYMVRAKPGQLAAAMRDAPKALYAQSRMRIIDPKDGVMTFAQVRQRVYDSDRGMAILMGIISVVLLAITAAGIVGLTSFWVGQRRKQIGVRRALGATRGDILGYFLTENFLIAVGGVLVGSVLAIGINLWMVAQIRDGAAVAGLCTCSRAWWRCCCSGRARCWRRRCARRACRRWRPRVRYEWFRSSSRKAAQCRSEWACSATTSNWPCAA